MAPPRTVPMKRCAWQACRRVFRPRTMKQASNPIGCCSLRCGKRLQHRRQPHLLARKSAAASIARARRRVELDILATYGPLSAREIALFNCGLRTGYLRGYSKAYGPRRASEVAA